MSVYNPYPDYIPSDVEWLGQIPAHWRIVRLARLTECLDGQRIPLNAEERGHMQGEYPYWGANSIVDYIDRWMFDEELVLIGEDGAPFLDRNRDVAFTVNGKVWVNNHAHVLRPRSEIHAPFLTSVLNCVDYAAFIDGSTRDKLTQSDMNVIPVQVPPLAEQGIIARFLSRETARIDALIAKKERLIELLQEKRTSLISRIVTKGLDPNAPMKNSGVEWLGEIPAHWEVKRLKNAGEAETGLTYSPDDVVGRDDGLLVLRASNISDGRIVYRDNVYVQCSIPEKLVTKVGDILICSRSGSRALIGKNAKIDRESAGMTFGAFMTIFRSIHNDYLHHVFNSALFEFQSGVFVTSTINQLTLGMLNSFSVPLPPSHEQRAIAEFLDREIARIDGLITKIHEAIERLREFRTAVISAAVTGKIDVREEVA